MRTHGSGSKRRPTAPPRFRSRLGTSIALLALTVSACAREQTRPADLLFEGDSDIAGWSTDGYPDAANVGVGGAVCRDVLDTIDDTLDIYQPSRVVLVCGENDLWEQSVRRTFNDFATVVERIHKTGATVYYMGTKPEPVTTPLHGDYRAYDARIRQHAMDLAGDDDAPLVLIDVYPGFEAVGNPDHLYQRDRLHLSRAGYELWDAWLTTAFTNSQCSVWESGVCQSGG